MPVITLPYRVNSRTITLDSALDPRAVALVRILKAFEKACRSLTMHMLKLRRINRHNLKVNKSLFFRVKMPKSETDEAPKVLEGLCFISEGSRKHGQYNSEAIENS